MIKYASIIITILSAALYTLGLTFYQGYLHELGVEESLFMMSIDRTLFHGFIASTHMSIKAIMWFVLAAEGVVLVAALGGYIIKIAINKNIFKNETFVQNNTENKNQESEQEQTFLKFSLNMLTIAIITFVGYIGIIFILMASSKSGEESAIKFKQSIKDKILPTVTITLKKDHEIINAYPIVCSKDQCSYYDGNKSFILSLSDIEKIESKK